MTFRHLLRSSVFVAGLLLLAVGIGDLVVGHSKVRQYEEFMRATQAVDAPDRTALFPTASEGQKRREIAELKLAFYRVLVSLGRYFTLLGILMVSAGAAHTWWLTHSSRAIAVLN